jgi:hypothetical protein
MPDYIPQKDAELVAWSTNFALQIFEHANDWGISSIDSYNLQTAVTDFAARHALADSPARTKIITEEKNVSRKALVGRVRGLVNFQLRNPVITDVERIAMGIPVHDTTRTSIPVPASRPGFGIKVLDIRRLSIIFHDLDSESKAKPYGVNGAVIVYDVLDAPPASPDRLSRNVLATRTPHTLEFTEEERGGKVYVAICWQNEKGQKGPWSEIESAIVP